ncbi:MAG: DUF3480 domain-containing protein [Pseudomonadales bacterium]|nr:DUF3480 domain-containing protein [Pseudomonadales bacterium]MBO6594754.1 DUF3480 domain-containing protein [Pseudomonadales bacterium]MBO6656559.1 DUF3480 domain-containing protein [Pseudomonadales bacterium]MBO6701260.1 DUF3480 domain-containing protein [Pseudomonadales bacterium]MBO6821686.1 DUF3480 domain-containing protein [Pseudomonadales bacterium]
MTFPVTANLDDQLKVDIHLHQIFLGDRDRYCWTYVTRGMTAHNQREMALSLIADDDADTEDFPKTPVKMFEQLAERTRTGKRVESGDATRLGQKGIFNFPCLFYVPAIQFPDMPSLDEHLALILVHEQEYDYAKQYGLTRFLSRLGKFCSSFPYPTWNTAARPTLFPDSIQELSILADASHIMAEHSHVHQQASVLQLQLQEQDADTVTAALKVLTKDQIATINTAFSPRCDASLYWQEGQTEPGAYAAPETSTGLIGGSFFSISFGDDPGMGIIEDGFSVTLPEAELHQFCEAADKQNAFEYEFQNGARFILDYLGRSARMRARGYDPAAVWRDLAVAEPSPVPQGTTTPASRVRAGELTNLLPSVSLASRISRHDLDDFVKRVEKSLDDAMSEEQDSFSFDVELRVRPGEITASVSSQDMDLNPEFAEFIRERVELEPACPVASEVRVRVPFSVN